MEKNRSRKVIGSINILHWSLKDEKISTLEQETKQEKNKGRLKQEIKGGKVVKESRKCDEKEGDVLLL